MIESIKIKNFMAFSEEVVVSFSPKINVIIGENGTGKSQILKLVHFLSREPLSLLKADKSAEFDTQLLTFEFLKYFLPFEDKLGKLHHKGAQNRSEIGIILDAHLRSMEFHNNSQKLIIKGYFSDNYNTTILPAKETLSFMEGFISMYNSYKVSYDKTYYDICLDLDHPVLRNEKISDTSKKCIKKIEDLCGGTFVFHGGGKVTFKTFDNEELSVNSMAEGFRKIGMLARLLKTGAINSENCGVFQWDEPEANMNPNIMKLLVEILLELARNGQQIILTTHDYVLLKWFDLLMDKEQGDEIHYHRLYRDEENIIRVKSYENYNDISTSGISETYAELYNADIKRTLGEV